LVEASDINAGNNMQQQSLGLGQSGYVDKGKTSKRERFLAEMDAVMPWARLEAVIAPVYPKGERGRPPIPLSVMLRVYCLQQWFNLSDPGVEEALMDIDCLRRFVGIGHGTDRIPDETVVLNFRRLLETHNLTEALFVAINTELAERGLIVGRGTIADATLIHAPSSTKNQDKARDPEMHRTKKGNQWHFGMKMHTGTDADSGLVHTVQATAANVHDSQVLGELLHGAEEALYADSASQSAAAEQLAQAAGIDWNVCARAARERPLTERQKRRNRTISQTRAFGEHPYRIVKQLWGHAKVRYRGLAKNLAQMRMLFALANVYLVRGVLAAAAQYMALPMQRGANTARHATSMPCNDVRNHVFPLQLHNNAGSPLRVMTKLKRSMHFSEVP
jgi:IS5 family transposase